MKVSVYDYKSKKQKRREKNPKTPLNTSPPPPPDLSNDSCGQLCFRDLINPLQLHEVLLNLGVGDGMFPCALPFC